MRHAPSMTKDVTPRKPKVEMLLIRGWSVSRASRTGILGSWSRQQSLLDLL